MKYPKGQFVIQVYKEGDEFFLNWNRHRIVCSEFYLGLSCVETKGNLFVRPFQGGSFGRCIYAKSLDETVRKANSVGVGVVQRDVICGIFISK